jgi:hypothetical protein
MRSSRRPSAARWASLASLGAAERGVRFAMNRSRLAVAALMLGFGAVHAWGVVAYSSLWLLIWVVPCFVGGFGLFLSKRWSQYLVYLVGACAVAGWAAYMLLYTSHQTPSQYMHRLYALGIAFVVVWGWSSIVVRRYFKSYARQI